MHGRVPLAMIGAFARQNPSLRLVVEPRQVELVVRAGGNTDPPDSGVFQLRPAGVAPVAAGQVVGFAGAVDAHDLAAQLVGAADGVLNGGPPLTELELLGHDHGTVALELQLPTNVVAFVRREEELEALPIEVGVRQLEPLWIFGVDRRVRHLTAYALHVAD